MASGNTCICGVRRAVITACAALLCAAPAPARAAGEASGDFLKFAPGPRGTGMGEAYTAVADDIYSSWWNPAGLASLEVPEAGATYNASMESVNHQYVSFAYPLRFGSVFAVSFTRLSVGAFQGYDAAGYKTANVDASDTAFATSYAKTLLKDEIERPVFNVGATVKAINSRLSDISASAAAFDVGAIYYLRPEHYWMTNVPGQEFRFALAVKNVGSGLKYDKLTFPLPRSATLGAAWISHPLGAHTLTLAMDQTFSNDDKYVAAFGAEYFMFQLLSLRAGYKTGQDIGSGVRFGFGFRLSFADLDYSMSPFGDLGAMHKIGISARFGASKAAQPLAGATARVSGAAVAAPKEKIEQLATFAADYLTLAQKDLDAARYLPASGDLSKAFNLQPDLKNGVWGDKAARLAQLTDKLRLKDNASREEVLSADNDQAKTAHSAIVAYLEGNSHKAFLFAHAALGANPRGDSVFEELLGLMADLTHGAVRRDEILPLDSLTREKLKKAAQYFYAQRFDMAAGECEEVTLLDPANAMAWTRLGSAYYMMGDKTKARSAYEAALKLRPDDPVINKFMETQHWK